ncbi:Abi-alpha family protein [Litorimonas sp. WD9-15]|uniref:Abi-alpha family protein n=1 Tax=Litorimonas sp. WD9-15 TaxID=3418716 RepID=UPI003D00C0B2
MEETWELAALAMTNNATEISIGKEGFSFKTDSEAGARLANAALDFLSPITEGAGFLGTKLRGFRMEAALNALLKAKKICDENSLSINPIPPKFLLQWVEGASLEADIEDNLSELWAKLLVDASQNNPSQNLIFIDILKKLSRSHVEYLQYLSGSGVYDDAPFIFRPYDVSRAINDGRVIQNAMGSIPREEWGKYIISDKDFLSSALEAIKDFFAEDGVEFRGLLSKQLKTRITDPDYFDTKIYSIEKEKFFSDEVLEGLEALGLIKFMEINELRVHDRHSFFVEYVLLTNFGVTFIKSCMAEIENDQ